MSEWVRLSVRHNGDNLRRCFDVSLSAPSSLLPKRFRRAVYAEALGDLGDMMDDCVRAGHSTDPFDALSQRLTEIVPPALRAALAKAMKPGRALLLDLPAELARLPWECVKIDAARGLSGNTWGTAYRAVRLARGNSAIAREPRYALLYDPSLLPDCDASLVMWAKAYPGAQALTEELQPENKEETQRRLRDAMSAYGLMHIVSHGRYALRSVRRATIGLVIDLSGRHSAQEMEILSPQAMDGDALLTPPVVVLDCCHSAKIDAANAERNFVHAFIAKGSTRLLLGNLDEAEPQQGKGSFFAEEWLPRLINGQSSFADCLAAVRDEKGEREFIGIKNYIAACFIGEGVLPDFTFGELLAGRRAAPWKPLPSLLRCFGAALLLCAAAICCFALAGMGIAKIPWLTMAACFIVLGGGLFVIFNFRQILALLGA